MRWGNADAPSPSTKHKACSHCLWRWASLAPSVWCILVILQGDHRLKVVLQLQKVPKYLDGRPAHAAGGPPRAALALRARLDLHVLVRPVEAALLLLLLLPLPRRQGLLVQRRLPPSKTSSWVSASILRMDRASCTLQARRGGGFRTLSGCPDDRQLL